MDGVEEAVEAEDLVFANLLLVLLQGVEGFGVDDDRMQPRKPGVCLPWLRGSFSRFMSREGEEGEEV